MVLCVIGVADSQIVTEVRSDIEYWVGVIIKIFEIITVFLSGIFLLYVFLVCIWRCTEAVVVKSKLPEEIIADQEVVEAMPGCLKWIYKFVKLLLDRVYFLLTLLMPKQIKEDRWAILMVVYLICILLTISLIIIFELLLKIPINLLFFKNWKYEVVFHSVGVVIIMLGFGVLGYFFILTKRNRISVL